VEVICADAALSDCYAGRVPVDLVLVCGVFGNISDADIRALIGRLTSLCARGGRVIWTRHRNEPDVTPAIRGWLADEGFEELSFDAPDDAHYGVGVHRSTRPHTPLEAGVRLFEFVGYDVLASE
jgi:hypothetical protein